MVNGVEVIAGTEGATVNKCQPEMAVKPAEGWEDNVWAGLPAQHEQ